MKKNGPDYKHKKGRCSVDCPYYRVGSTTHKYQCELTGQLVVAGRAKCNPYLSDRAKRKAAKEIHCPRCKMTKAELKQWRKDHPYDEV